MIETYFEQGDSRKDCELKIMEKYKRPFQIVSAKEIRFGGFLGLFPKTGIQVEFYFPSYNRTPVTHNYQSSPPVSWNISDVSETRQSQSSPDLEEVKRRVLAAAGKDYDRIAANGKELSQQILDSLNKLNEKIDGGSKKDEHQSFVQARELLKKNDFSENYIDEMLEKLRNEITFNIADNFDIVQDRLLELIGETISIFKEETPARRPRIMVLVGPTGVGKTTTISKLAAIYGIGTNEKTAIDVRLITIDMYRIGAKDQLEATGNIMQIPVTCVVDKQSMRKEIAIHSDDTDMFLVDTIGKSPKDAIKLGEMKEILDGAGRNAEFHLVISASTKTSDIENIMRQFEPFNYKSVVLTKMDETDRIGNIISALAEKKKSVSFITNGQALPGDIYRASVVRFLINLDGFKVNREKMEKYFPSKEADQFRWR